MAVEVNVKSNIKAIMKETRHIVKKDLPKSFGKAIEEAAFETSKILNYATTRYFDKPTKWTQRSFGYRRTKTNQKTINDKTAYVGVKGAPHIQVGAGDASQVWRRLKMFTMMIYGGTREAGLSGYLLKPAKHSKLNQYGNFPKTFWKNAEANKNKYFQGIPKGLKGEKFRGIWEKKKDGNVMVAKLDRTTTYNQKFFPFHMIARRTIDKIVPKAFRRNNAKYVKQLYHPPVR